MRFSFFPLTYKAQATLGVSETFDNDLAHVLSYLNPSNDPVVTHLLSAEVIAMRTAWIMGKKNRVEYWREIDEHSELLAEGEYDYCADMVAALRAVRRQHIRQKAFESLSKVDVESINIEPWVADINAEARLYFKSAEIAGNLFSQGQDVLSVPDLFDSLYFLDYHQLLSPYTKTTNDLSMLLLESREPPDMRVFRLDRKNLAGEEVHDYYHGVGVYSSLFRQSSLLLLNQMHDMLKTPRDTQSLLKLSTAVLRDGEIPLPTALTIQAWYSLFGLTSWKLTRRERKLLWNERRQDMTHIMFSALPFMPMTFDNSRGTVQDVGVANDASDSLSSRSKAHHRDSYGRIRYGEWMLFGAMWNEARPEDVDMLSLFRVSNLSVAADSLLGAFAPFLPRGFLAAVDQEERQFFMNIPGLSMRGLEIPIADIPNFPHNVFTSAHLSRDFTEEARRFARNYKVVCSFSEIPDGTSNEAAVQWISAYIQSMAQAWAANPVQLEIKQTRELISLGVRVFTELVSPSTRTKSGGKATFNF